MFVIPQEDADVVSSKNFKSVNLTKKRGCPSPCSLIAFLIFSISLSTFVSYGYLIEYANVNTVDYEGTFCQGVYGDGSNSKQSDSPLDGTNSGQFVYYTNYNEYTVDFVMNSNSAKTKLKGICVQSCPTKNDVICDYEYINKKLTIPLSKSMSVCSMPRTTQDQYMCSHCYLVPNNTYPLYYHCIPDLRDAPLTPQQEARFYQYQKSHPAKPVMVYELQGNNIIKKELPPQAPTIPESTFCLYPLSHYKVNTFNTTELKECKLKIPVGRTFNLLMDKLSFLSPDNFSTLLIDNLFDLLLYIVVIVIAFCIGFVFFRRSLPSVISLAVQLIIFSGLYIMVTSYLQYTESPIYDIIQKVQSLFKSENLLNMMSTVEKSIDNPHTVEKSSTFLTLKSIMKSVSKNSVSLVVVLLLIFGTFFILKSSLKQTIEHVTTLYSKPLVYFDFLLISLFYGSILYEILGVVGSLVVYSFGEFSTLLLSFYHQYIDLMSQYNLDHSTIMDYMNSHPLYQLFTLLIMPMFDSFIDIQEYPQLLLILLYFFGVMCFMLMDFVIYVISLSVYCWYFNDPYIYYFRYKNGRVIKNPLITDEMDEVDQQMGTISDIEYMMRKQVTNQQVFDNLQSIECKRTSLFLYVIKSIKFILTYYMGVVFLSANISLLIFFIDYQHYDGLYYLVLKACVSIVSRLHFYVGLIAMARHVSFTKAFNLVLRYIKNNWDLFIVSLSISKVLQSVFILIVNALSMNFQSFFMNDEMNNSHTTEVMMSLLDQGWLYLAANMKSTYFTFYFQSFFCSVCISLFTSCLNTYVLAYLEESYIIDTLDSYYRLCQSKDFYNNMGYTIPEEKKKTD